MHDLHRWSTIKYCSTIRESILRLYKPCVMLSFTRGHPSGWPKLPAEPPKFVEVLNSLKDLHHESQNRAHAKGSILRCVHHFSSILLGSHPLAPIMCDFHWFSLNFIDFQWFSLIFNFFITFCQSSSIDISFYKIFLDLSYEPSDAPHLEIFLNRGRTRIWLAARGKPSTMVTARRASRDENHSTCQTARWCQPAWQSAAAPHNSDDLCDARCA